MWQYTDHNSITSSVARNCSSSDDQGHFSNRNHHAVSDGNGNPKFSGRRLQLESWPNMITIPVYCIHFNFHVFISTFKVFFLGGGYILKKHMSKITSLRVIPTVTLYWNIFVINSDILSALRSLDFTRIILSSSSLLLVRGPAVTTVIYQAKLIQTDSRYAWFKTISDARASPDA